MSVARARAACGLHSGQKLDDLDDGLLRCVAAAASGSSSPAAQPVAQLCVVDSGGQVHPVTAGGPPVSVECPPPTADAPSILIRACQ